MRDALNDIAHDSPTKARNRPMLWHQNFYQISEKLNLFQFFADVVANCAYGLLLAEFCRTQPTAAHKRISLAISFAISLASQPWV